ncbi:MAG: ABC transporter permease, partial [Planctomycetota bacterium]
GALFAAVGLFASSLTGNQAISALIGFVMILILWAFVLLEQFFDGTGAHELIQSLSLFNRMDLLVAGRLDTRSLFLFASTTALMLYLTVRVVESRKWR